MEMCDLTKHPSLPKQVTTRINHLGETIDTLSHLEDSFEGMFLLKHFCKKNFPFKVHSLQDIAKYQVVGR